MNNPLIRPQGTSAVSRRGFLRVAGLSAAALGGGGLLAACGSDTPGTSSTTSSAAGTSASVESSTASSAMDTMSSTSAAAGGPATYIGGDYGDISIQFSWIKNIEFAGEFHATENGYYTEAGFGTVELVTGPVPSADELVAVGTATVGLSAPDATARYIKDQGAAIKVIGTTYQKNPFCILSLEEGKPIKTPEDLKGKNIGVQSGTNQDIFKGLLAANDIDASELTITTVLYDPSPLYENQIDGFMSYVTNEPIVAEAAGFTPVTLVFADNGLPLTAESFTVRQEDIDNNRDMLKAFLYAEIKGWTDAVADPEKSAELAVTKFGSDLDLNQEEQVLEAKAQNELVVSEDTKANGLFTLTDERMAEIVEAIGLTGYDITVEELFDLSLLNEVYADFPELITG